MSDKDWVNFGKQRVEKTKKAKMVNKVFSQVHENYDLMNDLMSLGIQRTWKIDFINLLEITSRDIILDLAGGTADLSLKALQAGLNPHNLTIVDYNQEMLAVGRDKLINTGYVGWNAIVGDAHNLPFCSQSFTKIMLGFGLRNFTDIPKALTELKRVLMPGGMVYILEFSQPENPVLAKLFTKYTENILPLLGRMVANDSESYQYLHESIVLHPKQDELKEMLGKAGFQDVNYVNFAGGIVAVHSGMVI